MLNKLQPRLEKKARTPHHAARLGPLGRWFRAPRARPSWGHGPGGPETGENEASPPDPRGPSHQPPQPPPTRRATYPGPLIRPLPPPLAQSQRRLLGGRRGFVSARSRAGSPISGRGGAEGGRAGGSGRGKRGPRSLATLRPMGNASWGAASPAGGCGGDSKAGLAVIGGAASGKGNGRCG